MSTIGLYDCSTAVQPNQTTSGSTSGVQDGLDGLEVYSRCCSCVPQRPLHTCHGNIRSRELALCIQSNSTGLVRTTAGQRRFAVDEPTTWNSVPPALRASELSQNVFRRALKTNLFLSARHCGDVLRDSGAEYKCTD